MNTPSLGKALNERLYFPAPANFSFKALDADMIEKRFADHLREHYPVGYGQEEDAVEHALASATRLEDQQEWSVMVATALGRDVTAASEYARTELPRSSAYVLGVEFAAEVVVRATIEPNVSAQLEYSREHPEVDLLWLPDASFAAGALVRRFRVVTQRDLTGAFRLVSVNTVFAPSLRPS